MSVRKKVLWGLLIVFVVFGVASVILTRYAAILSMKQGPLVSRITPSLVTQSLEDVVVTAHVVTDKDPGADILFVTTFLTFEIEIDNHRNDYIDFDYFDFFIWDEGHKIRPVSRDEVSREITARFIGTSLSPQATGRQMEMIKKADEAMLDSARIFTGYKRKGLVLFTLPAELSGEVTLSLRGLKTSEGAIGPYEFRFHVRQ
ncbi:MAG: hypothetical protein HZA19_00055 [Nitrospirae bacterium]|nr:hypothetical protein [Nitrospirota bacterium]